MSKKDIGLLLLILVVGTVVAIINPLFISPINLANTANLVGLFGIFAIGQAFVIITGGIELSVGSMIALLGRAVRRPDGQLRGGVAAGAGADADRSVS